MDKALWMHSVVIICMDRYSFGNEFSASCFALQNYTECTVCPGSSDPFYIVSYYIKRVITSWTFSTLQGRCPPKIHDQ